MLVYFNIHINFKGIEKRSEANNDHIFYGKSNFLIYFIHSYDIISFKWRTYELYLYKT